MAYGNARQLGYAEATSRNTGGLLKALLESLYAGSNASIDPNATPDSKTPFKGSGLFGGTKAGEANTKYNLERLQQLAQFQNQKAIMDKAQAIKDAEQTRQETEHGQAFGQLLSTLSPEQLASLHVPPNLAPEQLGRFVKAKYGQIGEQQGFVAQPTREQELGNTFKVQATQEHFQNLMGKDWVESSVPVGESRIQPFTGKSIQGMHTMTDRTSKQTGHMGINPLTGQYEFIPTGIHDTAHQYDVPASESSVKPAVSQDELNTSIQPVQQNNDFNPSNFIQGQGPVRATGGNGDLFNLNNLGLGNSDPSTIQPNPPAASGMPETTKGKFNLLDSVKPNIYGRMAGQDISDIGSFFKNLIVPKGAKLTDYGTTGKINRQKSLGQTTPASSFNLPSNPTQQPTDFFDTEPTDAEIARMKSANGINQNFNPTAAVPGSPFNANQPGNTPVGNMTIQQLLSLIKRQGLNAGGGF